MTALTRRRFLAISAASAAVPAYASNLPTATWRGIALGAPASLKIAGLEQEQAQPIFNAVEGELKRLEMIFSLYKDGSEIRQLNTTGKLVAPSPELLEVLSLADNIHRATDGAFDPSVQPLWLATAQGQAPEHPQTSNWSLLRFDSLEIGFAAPNPTGLGLTLNGIAQGAVTDRIAAVLREQGLTDVLIDMGEVAAQGQSPDGTTWRVGVAAPDGRVVNRISLSNRALATSAPDMPDASGKVRRHILPPTAKHQIRQSLVSISAPTAAVADGLSTACCLLGGGEISQVLSQFPGTRLETLHGTT